MRNRTLLTLSWDFNSKFTTVYEEKLLYDTTDLISWLGGAIGIFVGYSAFDLTNQIIDVTFNYIVRLTTRDGTRNSGSVQPQQPLQPPVVPPTKPSRPKSNYYEYDYNSHSSQLHHGGVGRTLQDGLNPASFASTGTGTSGSSSSQYYSNSSDHHPSMYSLPRSTSGYP